MFGRTRTLYKTASESLLMACFLTHTLLNGEIQLKCPTIDVDKCLGLSVNVIITQEKNIKRFFYIPNPFGTWTVLALHNFLSYVAFSEICLFVISPNTCSEVIPYFLPSFLFSVCLVSVRFTKPSFLDISNVSF